MSNAQRRPGRLIQVGTKSHAWIQEPGGWFVSNAGVVIPSDGEITLIDTCATWRRTDELLNAVAPFGTVRSCVLTHGHGDHANGLGQLADDVGVYATAATIDSMRATGIEHFVGVFEQPEWGDLVLRLPDRELSGERTLVGGVRADTCPSVAHMAGDAVAWLEEDGVLFAGDLIFASSTPLALFGSITGWLEALDWVRTFGAEVVVPGHGPVLRGADVDVALGQLGGYLEAVVTAARSWLATGSSIEVACSRLRAGPWSDWTESAERLVANLIVARAELTGEPTSVPQAIGEVMRARNGALIRCCA